VDKWVAWSLDAGLLKRAPFRYVDKTVMTPAGPRRVHVNAETESDPQDEPLRFVSFEDYLLWRNVGLRGELLEGGTDPAWRGRHGERNALFADGLVHSGMRLSEGAGLLVPEVPLPGGPVSSGWRGRWPSGAGAAGCCCRRARCQFHHFLAVERDAIVARCTAEGRFTPAATDRTVIRTGRHALVLDGGARSWPYGRIGPAERRLLVRRTGEPLWFRPADDGRPLEPAARQAVFRRANARGRTLQWFLGHAREATVYVYLDVLDEAQEIVLAALAEWDAQSVALERAMEAS
jgi:prepilin-type processing-associated H-X9-DG protein